MPTAPPVYSPIGTMCHACRGKLQAYTYYASQKKTLRPGTYLRLHENKWAAAEEIFITGEMWDPCVNPSHHPTITTRESLFVGIDVGIKHDNAARVAVRWDEKGQGLMLVSHRIWKPTPHQPINLENTIEQDLRDLNDHADVVEILADPYQMHRSITTLQAAGLPIREFPQTQANCTLMGQTLFDLLTGNNLEIYPAQDLREQALSTVAVENPRGWRIAKEKASKKIDAIVALAMACCAAMAHRGEIQSRVARGFNQAVHVQEAIVPVRGPVYIGQTFELPATVIAQANRGAIYALAAFASEQMSLRRHLETIVKPWLAANCRWALSDRRLILGAMEDVDPQAQCTFTEILENVIGGVWDSPVNPWGSRREAMLDLFGKATPFTMAPALQIHKTNGRLLVEALSGRWSYDHERRDKRDAWYYVANAFSLCVDRIGPGAPSGGNDYEVLTNWDYRRNLPASRERPYSARTGNTYKVRTNGNYDYDD